MERTVQDQDPPNGRNRLLKAAIVLFGQKGFAATSVRAIAEEADISWGLVRFYFGSKGGLLDAAEKWVVEAYLDRVIVGAHATTTEELSRAIEETRNLADVARFLRRAIIEERPIGLTFLEKLLTTGGDWPARLLSEFPDEDWLQDPVRNVVARLGYLLFAPQFQRLLGRDIFSMEELKLRNHQHNRMFELIRLGLLAEREGIKLPNQDEGRIARSPATDRPSTSD